ncbi:MAG: hypothetical protein AAF684_06875, partial [Pseudomonadota bacterium]
MIRRTAFAAAFAVAFAPFAHPAAADFIAEVISAPVSPNGLLNGAPSGLNIVLQRDDAPGARFLDPTVIGYGLEPGGVLEIDMREGFARDPSVPIDERSLLLVAGTPQQAIGAGPAGYRVEEGRTPNIFRVVALRPEGMPAAGLTSSTPGAADDPIPQRGFKIIHIGRSFPFVNRGARGVIDARIYDGAGVIVAEGRRAVDFLQSPAPQIFPTNIPDGRRNRNWQIVRPGAILGADRGTLPLSFLLFDRNAGDGTRGLFGVGVLSAAQIDAFGIGRPAAMARFPSGLILQDSDGDGALDPRIDRVIGGVRETAPPGARGSFATSPLARGRPLLSQPTEQLDPQVGPRVG